MAETTPKSDPVDTPMELETEPNKFVLPGDIFNILLFPNTLCTTGCIAMLLVFCFFCRLHIDYLMEITLLVYIFYYFFKTTQHSTTHTVPIKFCYITII